MLQKRAPNRFIKSKRGGAIVVLAALTLPILFLLAAFCINLAYVQLARTELMVATDAAARAGGRAFSHYQNIDDAKTAAQITAALNTVGGDSLTLSFDTEDNEIEFGSSDRNQEADRYDFTKVPESQVYSGTEIVNAMRISGKLTGDSSNGPLNALFPSMGLKSTFNLQSQAVAMQLDRDIALILDRSGSMSWVTYNWPNGFNQWSTTVKLAAVVEGILGVGSYTRRGRTYSYYYYTSGNNQDSYYQWVWEDYLQAGPAPRAPWDDLVDAVDTFLNVLETTDQQEKVSLATYSSSATLNLNLVSDYDEVRNELNSINPSGSTAIGYGLQTGLPSLLNTSFARPYAAKTIVVMTDGIHNYGIDPVVATQSIMQNYNVTIHTVTFGAGADQARMADVAEIGGGNHYHAATGEELIAVFEEIANNLPTLITQ